MVDHPEHGHEAVDGHSHLEAGSRIASLAVDVALLAARLARASHATERSAAAAPRGYALPSAESLDADSGARVLEDVPEEERRQGLAQTLEYLGRRRNDLMEARVQTPYVNYVAPSNVPTDCEIWAADYRQQLAPEDPYRADGPPLNVNGTRQAAETLDAARSAILQAIDHQLPRC